MPPIRLRVPRYDLDCQVELLPDLAPAAVAQLLAALPAEGLVTTESSYGSNLCLRLPNFSQALMSENATIFPTPGDVFLFSSPHGVELVAYYQRLAGSVPAGTPFDALGAKPGSRVGVITNRTPAFVDAATRVWSEGAAWGLACADDGQSSVLARDDRPAAAQELQHRHAAWLRQTRHDHVGLAPANGRQVRLTLAEYNVHTLVRLADDVAPETCENIWNHLPISLTAMHGRYSGPEVFTNAAEVAQHWRWIARPENSTAFPIPGDMVLYIEPSPRLQLNYFHDRGSIPYGVTRPEIGNLVGSSVGDFGAFAEACWRLAFEGWKTLHVERVA